MALRKVIVQQAVDTAIMAAGDVVATTLITFPNVVDAGKSTGLIREVTITDPDANSAANSVSELWLFNASVTPAAANAAHSISDADAKNLEAIIAFAAADAFLSALNTTAWKSPAASVPFNLPAGTSLFGILVTRATPTYAGGTIQIQLQVES